MANDGAFGEDTAYSWAFALHYFDSDVIEASSFSIIFMAAGLPDRYYITSQQGINYQLRTILQFLSAPELSIQITT